jgi:hypothetical protein
MVRILLLAFPLAFLAACQHRPPASPHCVDNTTLQLKRIDDRVKKYQSGEHSPGAVYWSRYYLETARFVLTGKGIDGSGAACTARDRESSDAPTLAKQLSAREKDVKWMEEQRGVSFDGIENNGLKWTWIKSAQPVSNNDANTL